MHHTYFHDSMNFIASYESKSLTIYSHWNVLIMEVCMVNINLEKFAQHQNRECYNVKKTVQNTLMVYTNPKIWPLKCKEPNINFLWYSVQSCNKVIPTFESLDKLWKVSIHIKLHALIYLLGHILCFNTFTKWRFRLGLNFGFWCVPEQRIIWM